MRSPSSELPAWQAAALGGLQGPAELLPISSSAHTTAFAWLMRWRYSELDAELRKSFEVALHAGTALALLVSERSEILPALDRRTLPVTAAACVPPAIAGYALEGKIESRLGTPATIAAGLLAGSVAMVLADGVPGRREWRDAGLRDGLWLGAAQSAALLPGISRSGATTSAARLLGFASRDAKSLSDQVGLPVLAGAALLKTIRLVQGGLERERVPAFAAGVASSFASTLLCIALMHRRRSAPRLTPYAVYRLAVAVALIRLGGGSTARRRGRARA
jgi:undecaprenyl-diphosphatase